MRTPSKFKEVDPAPRPAYSLQLPKKMIVKERKQVRQLLRSMLPMEDEQRQLQEEQKLFHKPGKAQ